MPYQDQDAERACWRRYYRRNKERFRLRNKVKREQIKNFVRDLKSQACSDCGITYPYYVMDFDHVRGKKTENIGRLANCNVMNKLKKELKKCDLVCANCHRIRTYNRSTVVVV